MATHPSTLAGKFHGWRSLVGCSLWGRKESDTTEQLHWFTECSGDHVQVTQSCLTLCDPMDCSLLGSSIHGIFQAGVLEWVAIAFSM